MIRVGAVVKHDQVGWMRDMGMLLRSKSSEGVSDSEATYVCTGLQ